MPGMSGLVLIYLVLSCGTCTSQVKKTLSKTYILSLPKLVTYFQDAHPSIKVAMSYGSNLPTDVACKQILCKGSSVACHICLQESWRFQEPSIMQDFGNT